MSRTTKDNTPSSPALFLLLCGVLSALCLWGGLFGPVGRSLLRIDGLSGTFLLPSWRFILLLLGLSLCCMLMLFYYPRKLSRKKGGMLLLGLSLFCRLLLLPHPHSDDLNRYLWEGRMISEGKNPYHQGPRSQALSDLAENDPYHAGINHPEISAAYPPLSLLIFSAAGRISYTPGAIKIMVLLFDMGTILFLILILNRRALDPGWVVLYCFNPVILISFAGKGHYDAVQLFFLTGALYFHGKNRWFAMFLFLGLGIQVKYVAAVVLPFFILRNNVKYLPVAIASALLPFLPFLDGGPAGLFSGITKFGGDLAFNGSIHWIPRVIAKEISPATGICTATLFVFLCHGYFRYHPQRKTVHRNDPLPGSLHALGLVLIFAPTVHYWYLSWIIPLLVLRPSLPWLALTVSFSFYFTVCGYVWHENRWHLPFFFLLMEWLPFYALLLLDLKRFFKYPAPGVQYKIPESVSVVIPVKNESGNIEECIKSVRRDRAVGEVIVVDASSGDHTPLIAEKAGATVFIYTPGEGGGGRGGQILAGVSAAKGDIAAVVHADARITVPVFTEMIRVLTENGDVVGGAVGTGFSQTSPAFRLLELANGFRAVFLGISFGDQVQFFRRVPVLEKELLAPIPLMEDVELSIRMRSAGRTLFLFGGGRVSARRWKKKGAANSVDVILRVLHYLALRTKGTPDTSAMYRDYYGCSLEDPG